MAENDGIGCVELGLIQGFQRYLAFENRTYGSTVACLNAPPTLTRWWRQRVRGVDLTLGEKRQDTVANKTAKFQNF